MARNPILCLILSAQFVLGLQLPAFSQQADLNLTSTTPSMPASSLGTSKGLAIQVGGKVMHVTSTSMLTPAQYVAATQVLASGTQHLQVGANGNATGGYFNMTPSLNQAISNLIVPQGVRVFDNFGTNSALNASGMLSNAGTIIGYSTNANVNTATIAANSIMNLPGGLLTTVAQSFVPSALPKLNLSITTVGDFINSGTVTSSGDLSVQAGGSIVNAGAPAPIMQAANNVNLTTGAGNLVNAGVIASTNNSINIATVNAATNLHVTASGGTFSAPAGDINIRDQQFTGTGNVDVRGGDFQSQRLNVFSGEGAINANFNSVSGQLNSAANVAHISVDSGTLHLGEQKIDGDPTFINANGGIDISGPITASESVAILADGDITVSGNGQIQLNSTTNTPFNLTMVAGAKITPNGNTDSGSLPGGGVPTTTDVDVDFSQGNGGNINLVGSSVTTPIIDTSGSGNGAGGSVVLAARSNAGVGGNVSLPSNAINASGAGTGANGNVTIIAGAPSGAAISSGAITTNQGSGTAGDITMVTAQPTGTGGSTVTFNPQGTATAGAPIVPSSTLTNGDISLTSDASSGLGVVSITSGLNQGNITMNAGGDITTSTILGGANVSMTSGGAQGIRLQGYGILSPSSTVTLTTTGTGDIRGQTRLVTTLPLANPGSVSLLLPNGQFVYASDGNNIDVFSTATYSQVGAIPAGNTPYSAVFSSNNNSVYVTNTGSGNVTVIDTATNTVTNTINVGTNPRGIAATPDGKFVYVANNGSGNISKIDTSTNLVVATISLAGAGFGNPTSVAVDTSQNILYVSDSVTPNILMIDTETNTTVGLIATVPGSNANLTFNPAGGSLYAAVAGTGTFAVDTNTKQVTSILPAGQTVNFYPQGTVGLITTGTGTFRFDSVLGTGVNFAVPTTGGFGAPVGTVPNSFVGGQFQGVNFQAFLPSAVSNAINAFQTASVVGDTVVLASKSGNVFINTLTPNLTAYSGGDATKNVFISQIGTVTLQPAVVDVGTGSMTVNSGVGGTFQLGSSPYNGLPASMNVSVGNPNAAVSATNVYLFSPTGNIGTSLNPFTLAPAVAAINLVVTAEANKSGFGNAYLTVRGVDVGPASPVVNSIAAYVGGKTPLDNTTGNFSLVATQGGVSLNKLISTGTSTTVVAATNILQNGAGNVSGGQSVTLAALDGDINLAAFVTGSKSITILADGDITEVGNANVLANSTTSTPANVTLVAGAQITPGVNSLSVDFSAGNGGNINLGGVGGAAPISTAGAAGSGGAGGDVVLAARYDSGTTNGGTVITSASLPIVTSGDGAGANGDLKIFAGAPSGDSISTNSIVANQGTGTAGDITMVTAQPTATGGPTIVFNTITGGITSGGPIAPSSTLENANINLSSDPNSGLGVVSIRSGVNAGNITLTAGGDISTFTILGGANVTMTSGGPFGINLQGYGILAPSSTIRLTTNGTGDIRGSTRLVTTLPLSGLGSMSVLLPNGSFVYASDGNSIRVFETGTYSEFTAPIVVGIAPYSGVYSSSNNALYVTNSGSSSVSVIDTSSNNVVATINVGSTPQGIAVTPNGQFVYVANSGSASISVIDTSTNTVVATIPLTGSGVTNPTSIAVNTSQNLAYVSDSTSNNIAVINTQTNALSGTTITALPIGANGSSLTFMPAGNLLYAAIPSGPGAGTYAINTTVNQLSGAPLPAGQTVNFYPQGTVGLITAGNSTFRFDTTLGTGRTFMVPTTGGFGSPVGTVPNNFGIGLQGVNYQAFLPSANTNAINAFQTASVVGGTVVLASKSGDIFINTLTDNLTAYSGGNINRNVFISQIGSVTLRPAIVDVGTGSMTVNSGVTGTFQLGSSSYNGAPANIDVSVGNPSPAITATTVYLFTPTGNIGTSANPVTLGTVLGQQLGLLVTAEANKPGLGNVYLTVKGNDLSADAPALVLDEVSVGGQTPVDSTTGNFSLTTIDGGILANAVVSATTSTTLIAATNVLQKNVGSIFTGTLNLLALDGDVLINGPVIGSANATILANGYIILSENGHIQLSSTTATPANLTMVAGAQITPGAGTNTVDFSQGNGGNIESDTSTFNGPVISTAGAAGTGGAGGNIILGARYDSGTGGQITLSSNAIDASGDGLGANGSVSLFAGAPSGNSIASGVITVNQGVGTAGNITMVTAQPSATTGNTVDIDLNGAILTGGPITASSTLESANIVLGSDASSGLGVVSINSSANAGTITMTAGGDITTSTILGGSNIAMTSGGSNGIRLQGYGILAPSSTITLTTNGTGDIRGATRLVTTLPLSTTVTSMSVLLPNGRFVYASDGNSVVVFSTSTYSQVGAAIPVGTNPFMGVYSSASNSLYVTNTGSDTVSVIDTGSNSVVATVSVGTSPKGVAVSPDGQFVYVANNGNNTVSVIDTATNLVVDTISLAGTGVTNPSGIAFNTSQNLAYVSDSASNTIALINTRTGLAEGTTITLPSGANNASLTFMPAGNLLYAAVASGGSAGTYSINTTTNQVSATVLPAGDTVNFYPQGTVGLITAGANGTFRFDTVLGTGVTFGVNTSGGFGSPVGAVPNSFGGGEFQGVNYQAFLPALGDNAINAFQTASVVGSRVVLASKSGNIFINTLTNNLTAFSGGDSTKNVFISQIGSVTLSPATVDVGTGSMTVNSGVGGTFQLGSSPYNGSPANINVAAGNPSPAVTALTAYLFTPTGNIGTAANPFTLGTISGQQLSLRVTAEANVSGRGNVYLSVTGTDVSGQPAVELDEISAGGETPVDATTGNFSLNATQGGIGLNAVVSAMTSAKLSGLTNIVQQAGGGLFSRNIDLSVLAGDIGASGVGNAIATDSSGSMTLHAGGGIFVDQTGAFTLNASQAGSTFQLNSTGSTTLNSIASLAGGVSVILGSSAGVLNVAPNSAISASNGSVILENDNTTSGAITIGANTYITAGSPVTGSGEVDIVIGPVPATPVAGRRPANVTATQLSGGRVFYGTNSITGLAPTNTITARGRNVIFSTGTLAPSAITLGGNTSINAGNAALLTSLDLSNPIIASQVSALQSTGAIGGKLVLSGGVATGGTVILAPGNLSSILSGENIPSGVTVTFRNFTTATPVNINLTAGQVVINGTQKFTGTAGITNVHSTLGGTLFNEGSTGIISAAKVLQINVAGDATYNGKLSAPTTTLSAIAGSGGSLSLGGAIGLTSTRSLTLRADGAGLVTQTAGTISGRQIAVSSGTGNISIPAFGAGSTVSVNTGGAVSIDSLAALSIQNSSSGGTFNVSSGTTLAILGTINASNVIMSPGTTLSLSGTVGNGTGTVDITLIGTGRMTRRLATANIFADDVTITAGRGALGTAAAPITLTANTLSINTATGSNAFISNNGSLTIDGSTVGRNLTVQSSTGLTVGDVSSIAGALRFTATNGTLLVLPGATVTANGGNLTLQNLNTSTGTIEFGAGSNVTASTARGGLLTVFVGTGTVPRTNTTPPANVTPVVTGTGRIFYGAASILANTPTNTINANNRTVIFSGPAGAIILDGGVTLTADPVGFVQGEAGEFVVDTEEDSVVEPLAYDLH